MNSSLSVILINYNHSSYLKRAIEQRLAQKKSFSELILVDDGSTDDSSIIVKEYAKQHDFIRPVFHKKNEGINRAIYSGVIKSKGDFIHIGAVDDIIDKTFFKESMNILNKFPESGFVFSDAGEFLEKKEQHINFPFYFSSKSTYFSPAEIKNLFKKSFFTFPSLSCIFNRKKLLEIGCFDSKLDRAADIFSTFLLSLRYGVCYVPKTISWFCIRKDSYSSVGLRDSSNQKKIFYKMIQVLREEFPGDYKSFKESGIVYENSFRAFWWLISSPECYDYITFLLVKRLILRGIWFRLKRIFPLSLRLIIRKLRGKIFNRIINGEKE